MLADNRVEARDGPYGRESRRCRAVVFIVTPNRGEFSERSRLVCVAVGLALLLGAFLVLGVASIGRRHGD